MTTISRRDFIRAAGAMTALSALGYVPSGFAKGSRVVVVGGGYGGTIAAKYIRMLIHPSM